MMLAGEVIRIAAWFLALLEFVVAVYVLLLNVHHIANRQVGALLLLFAVNHFGMGWLAVAGDAAQVRAPTLLLAVTCGPTTVGLLLTALVLLKPQWGRIPAVKWVMYGLGVLPALLTLVDWVSGAGLWFTGVGPYYAGGYVSTVEYIGGVLGPPLRFIYNVVVPTASLAVLLYLVFKDATLSPARRQLGRVLTVAQILGLVLQLGLLRLLGPMVGTLITSAAFASVYTYAVFQQMVSERREQRGKLQTRLTALVLVIAIPIAAATVALVNSQAAKIVSQAAEERLSVLGRATTANIQLWLEVHASALKQLVTHPDIVGMEAERQRPLLVAILKAHPHFYLVSIVDLQGISIARSDDLPPQDYSGYLWFVRARRGAKVTHQIVTHLAGVDGPALVVAVPVRDEAGNVVGVAMAADRLTSLEEVEPLAPIGETEFFFVVDDDGQVVVRSSGAAVEMLEDMRAYPPVDAIFRGAEGMFHFEDERETKWLAYVAGLDNGWGLVVQQEERELNAPLHRLERISGLLLAVCTVVLGALVFLTIRQTLWPIRELTDGAEAVARGELDRVVKVEGEDELGVLARSFNRMTEQLRHAIHDLEARVAARTEALERRSRYMELLALIGREAFRLLEDEAGLSRWLVSLVREQMGFYRVALFAVDVDGEWLDLMAVADEEKRPTLPALRVRAASGKAAGVAAMRGRYRVTSITEEMVPFEQGMASVRVELALPLHVRDTISGVLIIQEETKGAFDGEEVEMLQAVADHIAVVLNHARLFHRLEDALEAERRARGELTRAAWQELLRSEAGLGFVSDPRGTVPAGDMWDAEMMAAVQTGEVAAGGEEALAVPIVARGQVVGVVDAHLPEGTRGWTSEQRELLRTLAEQLGMALESAQLYRETQRRAARELLTREITEEMRRFVDIEAILRATITRLGRAMGVPRTYVRLVVGEEMLPVPTEDEEER